jgi:CBS domain-containing protein
MSLKTPKKGTSTTSSAISSTPIQADKSNTTLESRKRQSKRDEAIRRKVENDLSKKRFGQKSSNSASRRRNHQPGTVLSLKPSEAVVCRPSYTAYEAAQLMSAKRENCILVVDEEEHLLGIFTAKDLAFRVVSKGLAAGSVLIEQIMTPNPLCATSNTAASEALNLMVQKGFRHLPVLDEDSQSIYGVLDITKCYQEAMEKLERMYESSKKLHDALEGVSLEIGNGPQQPLQVIKYFESLKNVMNGPILENVLDDDSTLPTYVSVKTSVYEAAVLMKEHHTTAVLVKDVNDDVTGIFTSKDVVLRVIAAGLDPKTVSVIRVMTSQPDVASKNLTIQAALRKMFDGHYLNLPVVDETNEIIGIVEVLKLTWSTLNQISVMQSNNADDNESNGEGPAWNRFWKSLDNDTDSVHSDSQYGNTIPDISRSEINQFSMNDNLGPSDSISVTNEQSQHIESSAVSFGKQEVVNSSFTFKFKSPSGRVHRINVRPVDGFEEFHSVIKIKLNESEINELTKSGGDFAISYVDDEGDTVAITNDQDLIDCVLISKNSKLDKADIFIHGIDDEIDLTEFYLRKQQLKEQKLPQPSSQRHNDNGQIVPGVENAVLIGGAVSVLAAAIVIAFTLGKK